MSSIPIIIVVVASVAGGEISPLHDLRSQAVPKDDMRVAWLAVGSHLQGLTGLVTLYNTLDEPVLLRQSGHKLQHGRPTAASQRSFCWPTKNSVGGSPC